ncbi:MAG: hypothetical protein KC713_04485 [Candidatus Omnitrophica bacterium]|nr:hypothetical protein [Candidatus Omnitrophota bacterium]
MKLFNSLSVFVLLMAVPTTCFAWRGETPGKKAIRGAVNIVTSPIEIPKQARAYWIEGAQKTDHILVWIASGTVKGFVEMAKRWGSGARDIGTFYMNKRPEDRESLSQPEYAFQEWPRNPQTGR